MGLFYSICGVGVGLFWEFRFRASICSGGELDVVFRFFSRFREISLDIEFGCRRNSEFRVRLRIKTVDALTMSGEELGVGFLVFGLNSWDFVRHNDPGFWKNSRFQV